MAQAPSSGRRSWKETSAERRRRAPGTRRVLRWLITLGFLGLVGFFVWWLWPPRLDPAVLTIVQVRDWDRLAAPPMPFSEELQIELETLHEKIVQAKAAREAVQTANDLLGLDAWLNKQVNPGEVLVLYLAAHGVSENGKAYLLASDYKPRTDEGRVPLRDVLKQVSQCPAKVKLVLLDAGSVFSDPAMGMVVNEFPRLLEQEVQNSADPNLWVLASHSTFQISHTAHGKRRSLFGDMVFEALTGAADVRRDEELSLDELYGYVCDRAADWLDPALPPGQQPLLLQGTAGVVPPQGAAKQVTLVSLRKLLAERAAEEKAKQKAKEKEATPEQPKSASGAQKQSAAGPMRLLRGNAGLTAWAWAQPGAAAPPATEPPAAEPPAASAPPAAGAAPGAQKPTDSPTGGAAEKTEPPAAAGAGQGAAASPAAATGGAAEGANPAAAPGAPSPPAPKKAQTPAEPARPFDTHDYLRQAWERHDALAPRRSFDAAQLDPDKFWSPVDFAPHLWRVMEARLLALEMRCRAGAAFDADELAEEAEAMRDDLQALHDLVRAGKAPALPAQNRGAVDHLVIAHLHDAWRQFSADGTRRTSPATAKAVAAAQVYADALYRAPAYVAWHDRESFSSTGRPVSYKQVQTLLEALAALGDKLDEVRGGRLDSDDQDALSRMAAETAAAHHAVEQTLKDQAQRAPTLSSDLLGQNAEDLLGIPLLPADLRMRLNDHLQKERKPPQKKHRGVRVHAPDQSRTRWDRLRERAELHVRLVELLSPAEAAPLRAVLEEKIDPAPSPEKEESHPYTDYRTLSEGLRKFYAGLAAALSAPDAGGPALRAAWLIDARDVRPSDVVRMLDAYQFTPPPQAERLVVQAPPEVPLPDGPGVWRLLDVTITAEGEHSSSAQVQVQFDPARLKVRKPGSGQNLAPGDSLPVSFAESPAAPLALEVQALALSRAGEQTTLSLLAVSANGAQAAGRVVIRLPRPNEYDVLVASAGQGERFSGEKVVLRPFANRETPFRFSLANLSGQKKKVTVEVFAAQRPGPEIANWRVGQLFDNNRLLRDVEKLIFDPNTDGVRPGVTKVAATAQPVELPDSDEPVPVELAPLGAAPPAAPPGGAPPAAAEKPPATPLAIPVSHGLVMLITNAEKPGDRTVKWLELTPRVPKDYLDVTVVYERLPPNAGRIRATVKAREGGADLAALPPDLSKEKPLVVLWDTAGDVPPGAPKRERAEFDGSQPAEVSAEVPADGALREVRLSIGGYPRAFVFRVRCGERNSVGERLDPARASVKIKSVWSPTFRRGYVFDPDGALPPQAAGPDGKPLEQRYVPPGTRAAFPRSDQLLMRLEVDAPTDAFVLPYEQRKDSVQVTLGEAREVQTFYSSRDFSAEVRGAGPNGLVLASQADDYLLRLDTRGRQSRDDALEAELVLNGASAANDRVHLVLDDNPPRVLRVTATPQVQLGQPLQVEARVDDEGFSGVVQLEYGLDKKNPRVLDADEVISPNPEAAPVARGDAWSFTLETAELKVGRHTLLVRAVDDVDHRSEIDSVSFLVVPVPAPKKEEEKKGPSRGPITGEVVKGKAKVGGATVTLEGSGKPAVKTDPQGKFRFDDVPAGAYSLKVDGTFQNNFVKGEGKVQHNPPEKTPEVSIPVQ